MFFRVTLPKISGALLYGVLLTNARAIGEFGAVSVVSGSVRGETMTLPLQIELLEQDYNTVGPLPQPRCSRCLRWPRFFCAVIAAAPDFGEDAKFK